MHSKKPGPQRRICQTVAAVGFACALLLVSVSRTQAHSVTVFAWVEGNTVYVEGKFSGGRKPKKAPIEVYDRSGSLLLKGETDDQGKFVFQIPRRTEMKIVMQAGMGHKAEWIIPIEDLEGIEPAELEKPAPIGSTPSQPPDKADLADASSASGGPTEADIERAVEKVLEKKLRPVIRLLAESRQSGPDLRDVLGGLGYIIGLVGLAAYLRNRRSKKSPESSAADKRPPIPTDP